MSLPTLSLEGVSDPQVHDEDTEDVAELETSVDAMDTDTTISCRVNVSRAIMSPMNLVFIFNRNDWW